LAKKPAIRKDGGRRDGPAEAAAKVPQAFGIRSHDRTEAAPLRRADFAVPSPPRGPAIPGECGSHLHSPFVVPPRAGAPRMSEKNCPPPTDCDKLLTARRL